MKQLPPKIPNNAVIFVYNTTYHNKTKGQSTNNSNKKKQDIRNWLDEHNIQYDDQDIKKTLLDMVRQHRSEKLYLSDNTAHQHGHGHTLLCLPVAHC